MKSFYEFLTETISIEQINKNRGKQKVVVFIGRFQPPTKAHFNIIKEIFKKEHLPVVIDIVHGIKSGKNKQQNPFDFNIQKEIFVSCLGNSVNLVQTTSGFIGELLNILRNNNKEPVVLYCGSDRVKSYQKQIERYKEKLNLELIVKEIPRQNSDISATKVRQALLNDDLEIFKQLTDKCEWKFYDKLKSIIQKEIKQ